MIRQLKNIIKNVIFRYVIPPPIRSFSQAGEDAIINFLFNDKKIKRITFLDIGTNNPDYGNNTYLFYLNGNNGVCVEADNSIIPYIKKKRPGDTVLNIGISPIENTEADFYIFDANSINTFDKKEAEYRASLGNYKIQAVIKVPLRTINTVIEEQFKSYPDLLSIDVEGLDLAIIKSLDISKYPIPVICAETCTYSENHLRPKDPSIAEYLAANGYFIYADTYINTIFVNIDWFNKNHS